ncbi:hypothetical protein [Thermococcus peptonophilus]|uniref:Uncharacterized protein n=1 Tax=Thermococcus peptonophilus TaxID=53952 RepID=A0A142CV79_9EURY|nr:hypothetical protein [Thermococcus peptonophilus]AMQ18681.1 hypothetical protein A0127_05615 [Thermococcus peptonophilus]
MDVLEPLEQLVEALEVFTRIITEMALPSAAFIAGIIMYAFVVYVKDKLANALGIEPSNIFYQQANILINGLYVFVVLMGAVSSVFALRHLKDLPI